MNNNGGEWLSEDKEEFIPAGIKRDGKISIEFMYIYNDVLLQYPQNSELAISDDVLFNFEMVFEYLANGFE